MRVPSCAVGASPSAVQTSLANLQHSGHFVQAIPLQCSAFLPESLDAQTMTDGIVWLIASLAGRRYAADGGGHPTP